MAVGDALVTARKVSADFLSGNFRHTFPSTDCFIAHSLESESRETISTDVCGLVLDAETDGLIVGINFEIVIQREHGSGSVGLPLSLSCQGNVGFIVPAIPVGEGSVGDLFGGFRFANCSEVDEGAWVPSEICPVTIFGVSVLSTV